MARIQVTPRRHRKILRTGAAAGNSLVNTRPMGQIYHIVIEGEPISSLLSANHLRCQNLVLLKELRQVFLSQRKRIVRRTDHRLHGKFRKAQICHMEDIFCKIHIMMGKSSPHIVAFTTS